jgi:hypothetical protein
MAVVKHAINEGLAEVNDDEAAKLIESGGWVAVDAPTKKTPATRRRSTKSEG